MSLKPIACGLLALAGCVEGECMTTAQTGPGLSGAASYTLGDGSRLDVDLGARGWAELTAGTVTIDSKLTDAWGRERAFELHVRALSVGTFDLADHGDACMPRQSSGPSICAPLTGTIEVRALDEDCDFHSSGVGTCAETMDFTIAARSPWETTELVLDAEMLTVGSWVETECED
jgi:hypothetical protein